MQQMYEQKLIKMNRQSWEDWMNFLLHDPDQNQQLIWTLYSEMRNALV